MGGGGQKYGKEKKRLTLAEIASKHRRSDSDAYIFDIEYEKLKREQERVAREYARRREEYRRISEQLRAELANGTATNTDIARYMEVISDRGAELQQQQVRMQTEIDELENERADVENRMNALRNQAFAGSAKVETPSNVRQQYDGFKAGNRTKETIVEMTPEEFLRRAAFGRNGAGSIQQVLRSASPSEVEKYMRQMLRGTKFTAPSFSEEKGTTATANARVIAAMMNGYKRIPVMVVE